MSPVTFVHVLSASAAVVLGVCTGLASADLFAVVVPGRELNVLLFVELPNRLAGGLPGVLSTLL